MTPETVVRESLAQGAKLWAEAGALRYSGPGAAVAAPLPRFRARKPEPLAPLANERAEAAPLALRWRVVHADGHVSEWDSPGGLAEADVRALAEKFGGPVASLEPVAFQPKPKPKPKPEAADPDPVRCRDCRHWTPDAINPPHGLGKCAIRAWRLPWPGNSCSKGDAR
jgi:hypothetical protein